MFDNLGGGELLLIFLVILIFFGPKKIPELAGSLGKGLRKFREAKDGLDEQIKTAMKEPMDAVKETKAALQQQSTDLKTSFNEAAKTTAAPTPAEPTTPPPAVEH